MINQLNSLNSASLTPSSFFNEKENKKRFGGNERTTILVFSWLSREEILNCSEVNKFFKKIASCDQIWTVFNKERREFNRCRLETIRGYRFPIAGGFAAEVRCRQSDVPKIKGISELDHFYQNQLEGRLLRQKLGTHCGNMIVQSGFLAAFQLIYHLPTVLPESIPLPMLASIQTAASSVLGYRCSTLPKTMTKTRFALINTGFGLVNTLCIKTIGPVCLKGSVLATLGTTISSMAVYTIVKTKFPMNKKALMFTGIALGAAPALLFKAGLMAALTGAATGAGTVLSTIETTYLPQSFTISMPVAASIVGGLAHWTHYFPNAILAAQAIKYHNEDTNEKYPLVDRCRVACEALNPKRIWFTCIKIKAKFSFIAEKVVNFADLVIAYNG